VQNLGQCWVVVFQQGQIVGVKAPNVIFGGCIGDVKEIPGTGQTTVQWQLQMAKKWRGNYWNIKRIRQIINSCSPSIIFKAENIQMNLWTH
jgi:hypothetical protein